MNKPLYIGEPRWIEMVVEDRRTARLDYCVDFSSDTAREPALSRGVALRGTADPHEPYGRLTGLTRGSGGLPVSAAPIHHELDYLLRAESEKLAKEAVAVEQPAAIKVLQRPSNQPVEDFIGMAGQFEIAASTDRLDVTMLDAALPDGVVFLARTGESARRRRDRVLALLSSRTAKYVGASRAIGDEHWRLTAFPETERSRQVTLPEPWALDGLSDTEGGCRVRLTLRVTRGRNVYAELLRTAKEGETAPAIKLTDNHHLPREPMTVVFGEELLFMRRMALRFFGDALAENPEAEGEVNLDIVLDLVPDPLTASAARIAAQVSALLLAKLVDPVEAGQNSRLMAVEPAPRDDVEEPALKVLADWATPRGMPPLRAVMAAPAYERSDNAGLQVRWQAGDLVLVSVADGMIPAILGAPRLSRGALSENNAADMAIYGARVNLAERVLIEDELVELKADTKVHGNLDVK